MRRSQSIVRWVVLVFAPVALVCAPPGQSGGGGCPCQPAEEEPPPVAQEARQQLADIDAGLDGYSDETVNALAAEQGLDPGTTVSGAGDASVLNGAWTGTLVEQDTNKEQTAALDFGEQGELNQLTVYAEDAVETTLQFQNAGATDKVEVTARGLAARVFTDDGVNFRVIALALVDRTTDAGRSRSLDTLTIDFTLIRDELRFTGISRWSMEILATELPDEQVGSQVVEEATTELARNDPPTADAGPDRTFLDIDGNGTEPITLDGSASRDPDDEIVAYRWRLDGVEIAAGATAVVDLTGGVHQVRLIVADSRGALDIDTVAITVETWQTARLRLDVHIEGRTSQAKVAGRPAVSFWDTNANALMYIRSEEDRWRLTPVDGNRAGRGASLVEFDGYAAIAYWGAGALRAVELDGTNRNFTVIFETDL